MRTFRWRFDHDDGRVFFVYAPSRAVAGQRLAQYLDVPAAVIAARLVRAPSLNVR